jgi:hypothetical protein
MPAGLAISPSERSISMDTTLRGTSLTRRLMARISEDARKAKEDENGGSGDLATFLRPLVRELVHEAQSATGPRPTIVYTWTVSKVESIYEKLVEMLGDDGERVCVPRNHTVPALSTAFVHSSHCGVCAL